MSRGLPAVFNQSEFFLVPAPLPGAIRSKKWQFALRYRTRLIYVYNYPFNILSFCSALCLLLDLYNLHLFDGKLAPPDNSDWLKTAGSPRDIKLRHFYTCSKHSASGKSTLELSGGANFPSKR